MASQPERLPITTPDELLFSIFCIEGVAADTELGGTEAYRRLASSGIINDYLVPFYDVLHTQGREYVVRDVEELMRRRGVLA